MNNKDEIITMKSEYWKCDICDTKYENILFESKIRSTFPGSGANMFEEHSERFCFKCYADGVMWAMKQAQKEK